MLRIYRFDKESKSLLFSISSEDDIYLANTLFSELFTDVYVDWIYILEELHEKKDILNKKISVSVLEKNRGHHFVVVSVLREETIAVVSS